MWLVPLLVYSQVILSSSAPTDSSPFRSNAGVTLNGRKKVHGDGEKCPTKTVSNCRCRAKSEGLDITCENVNAQQLYNYAEILKKSGRERDEEHFIRYFKLRNSQIIRLEDHLFMGMKIEHLYIHDCNLQSLGPSSVSSQGETLKHLVLSKNKLSAVPTQAIRHLRNLEHLNLNENQIVTLENEAFMGLNKVTRLSLYHNRITHIQPSAFDGIKRDMQRLNMGKNKLNKIPHEALASCTYLEHLELSENPISVINPGDFNGLDNLDHLSMSHNLLDHLGKNYFTGLPMLSTLYIENNKITAVHTEAFSGLEAHLTSLSLAGNQLREFPSKALKPIHELTTLHMDDNKISILNERAFEGFGEHIKFLWLQNNQIQDIPPTAFQDLHSLEWIKLYNNLLTTLHYELMEPVLDSLQHIDIHSNPLLCDCELRWYHQWIEEEWNPVEQEWLKDTFCEDPADKKQHNIAEVPLKDMFCTTDVKDKPSARGDDGGAACLMTNWLVLFLSAVSIFARKDLFQF